MSYTKHSCSTQQTRGKSIILLTHEIHTLRVLTAAAAHCARHHSHRTMLPPHNPKLHKTSYRGVHTHSAAWLTTWRAHWGLKWMAFNTITEEMLQAQLAAAPGIWCSNPAIQALCSAESQPALRFNAVVVGQPTPNQPPGAHTLPPPAETRNNQHGTADDSYKLECWSAQKIPNEARSQHTPLCGQMCLYRLDTGPASRAARYAHGNEACRMTAKPRPTYSMENLNDNCCTALDNNSTNLAQAGRRNPAYTPVA